MPLVDGMTTGDYATNSTVPTPVLRNFVQSLATVGRHCFPDVLTVIQDLEADSGLDGDGKFCRAGYTIDMSVNLRNASHFDVGDASQGFCMWTESIPGAAENWYFVMPNVLGVDEVGKEFRGLAVKLSHGVAISFDGRVLRHCTSLSPPNAGCGALLSAPNLLFGSFTAAKERVLQAGRVHAFTMARKKERGFPQARKTQELGCHVASALNRQVVNGDPANVCGISRPLPPSIPLPLLTRKRQGDGPRLRKVDIPDALIASDSCSFMQAEQAEPSSRKSVRKKKHRKK